MEIENWRYSGDTDSTLSLLMLRGPATWEMLCFMCEDAYGALKVLGETRIPAGRYPVKLRTASPMSRRYEARYPETHRGMLWLQDVPGFIYVYMHIGNDEDDTQGCLLFGELRDEETRKVSFSRIAYERLYPRLAAAVETEGLWITVKDLDRPVLPGPV